MIPAPLTELQTLDGVDVASADAVQCLAWLDQLRPIQGWVDAFRAQVTGRLDQLAEVGESFGSEDANTRCSGMTASEAARHHQRAATLAVAAGFAAALAGGTITSEHVDRLGVVTTKLDDQIRAALFARSDELLRHAVAQDPARFARHARDLARRLERDAGIDRAQRQHHDTYVSWKVTGDGMYELHARLHPELGGRIVTALDAEVAATIARGEAAGDPDYVQRRVDRRRLAADALGKLVSCGHQTERQIVADISVIIDAESLITGRLGDSGVSETSHGAPIPIESVRALLCNATITPVISGPHRTPLNVGRSTRTATRQQRRALRTIYRTCALHGCDVPFDRCEFHHIIEWDHGGPTDLDNLIPTCARHHHQIHTHRWRLHLTPDRTLTISDRNDQTIMVTTPDMPTPHQPAKRPPPPHQAHPNLLAS